MKWNSLREPGPEAPSFVVILTGSLARYISPVLAVIWACGMAMTNPVIHFLTREFWLVGWFIGLFVKWGMLITGSVMGLVALVVAVASREGRLQALLVLIMLLAGFAFHFMANSLK